MERRLEAQAPTLGDVIRARRKELGLSQWDVAYRMGPTVQQADVSAIERGAIKLPRRERLEQIARALDIPMGELLARSGWATAEEYFGADDLGLGVGPPASPREVLGRIWPELAEADLDELEEKARVLREERARYEEKAG